MKKLLFLAISLLLVACEPSLQEKADKLARTETIKILNYPETYEAVETLVDSMFVNIRFDRKALAAAERIMELEDKKSSLEHSYRSALSDVATWSNPYGSYSRERLRQAKEKVNKTETELQEITTEIEAQENVIKERFVSIPTGEFCGWIIDHRFRCGDNKGIKNLTDILLISDENFEDVLLRFPIDPLDKDKLENLIKIIDRLTHPE